MFYLKHRPQTIQELDNQNVKEKLTLLLQNKNIPHAFLFTGQKGTGKTSSARIIAKAINCEENLYANKSNGFEPCNTCNNCKSITQGNCPDVIEMDAASNRKIDEVRDLISKIKFNPIIARYKVYIIDEVHMLTNEAFNALLKTLEEPPKNTIFILATTEINKLPKTIISRCLQVNFGKAKQEDILEMLKKLNEKEKLEIEENILKLIANHSENSFRDATKTLEEISINFKNKKITLEEIQSFIGLSENNFDLLQIIANKDLKKALEKLEIFAQNGGDTKTLIETLLTNLHDLLLKKNGIKIETEDYNFSIKEIAVLIKLFQEAYNGLKYSPIETLPLEVSIVEYFDKQNLINN